MLLFALQGDAILSAPGGVARIAVPLLIYFVGIFLGAFLLGRAIGLNYAKSTTVAFTASTTSKLTGPTAEARRSHDEVARR